MLTSMDKLYESVAANGPVCVGLDTEISYLPTTDTAKTAGENVVAFNRALIDATKGVAGCYKVQIAYYESLGLDGMRAYAETLKLARATGLHETKMHLDADEFLTPDRVPLEKAYQMVLSNEIKDGKTIAGILKLKALLAEGKL